MSRSRKKKTPKPTFLLDENIDIRIATFLKQRDFAVAITPKGIQNGAVAVLAQSKSAVLVTNDSDFTNTDLFKPAHYPGIIVFRIHPPTLMATRTSLEKLLITVNLNEFSGKLFIVGEKGVEVVS